MPMEIQKTLEDWGSGQVKFDMKETTHERTTGQTDDWLIEWLIDWMNEPMNETLKESTNERKKHMNALNGLKWTINVE